MGNRLVINNTADFSTQKSLNNKNRKQQATSFQGLGVNAVVNTMQAIENGGVASSFLVQDVLALNIPRSIYNLYRNNEITGELNKEASLETALREFLTGPSMFIIPGVLFAGTKAVFGKASDIQFPWLRRVGEHFENLEHTQTLKKSFSETNKSLQKAVLSNAFKKTFGEENITTKEIDNVIETINKIQGEKEKLAKTGRFDKTARTPIKEEIKKLQGEITEFVMNKNKTIGSNITKPNFVKFSAPGKSAVTKEIKIDELIKVTEKYSKDVVDKTIKKIKNISEKGTEVTQEHVKQFIEKANQRRLGGRLFSTLLAAAGIAGFSYFIPKLYSRSDTPPGEAGLHGGGNENK